MAEMKLSDYPKERRGILKRAQEQARKTNRSIIVGIDYDDQEFMDDAVDYYPGIELERVFAEVKPNGKIYKKFIHN